MSREGSVARPGNVLSYLPLMVSMSRTKGLLWSLRKLRWYSIKGSRLLVLLPFAILLRIALLSLKPVIHVRFGRFWSDRLGPFAMSTELYLCERDIGIQPKSLDLWYHHDRDSYMLRKPRTGRQFICNQQLSEMWERLIHVTDAARSMDCLNRVIGPGSGSFIVKDSHIDGLDRDNLLNKLPPHISFTASEEERGQNELLKLGISIGERFVCLHARDSAYLDLARPKNIEAFGDWHWQDLRDSDINNYREAADELTKLGYFVVRMGKFVKEPFVSDNQRIIDYATKCQSDFMDVFLSAHCSFFIGQTSGMTALPMILRKPVALMNVFPLAAISYCQNFKGNLITKKYYSNVRQRCLTYKEVFDLGLANTNIKLSEHQDLFQNLGLEIVENTPEEIREAALEMHHMLNSDYTEQRRRGATGSISFCRKLPSRRYSGMQQGA